MSQPEDFEIGVLTEAEEGVPLDPAVPAEVQFSQLRTAHSHHWQVLLDRTVFQAQVLQFAEITTQQLVEILTK